MYKVDWYTNLFSARLSAEEFVEITLFGKWGRIGKYYDRIFMFNLMFKTYLRANRLELRPNNKLNTF